MLDAKQVLHHHLRNGRDAVLWALEGLSEYDVRRPVTRSGTNLLGLVKHRAGIEANHLGEVFGRPCPGGPLPWHTEDAEDDAHAWASLDETRGDILDLHHRVAAHADATIEALDLDTAGVVPWWSADERDVTLHTMLVHVVAETHRLAGQADVVRELVDGALGTRAASLGLPGPSDTDRAAHRERLEQLARAAGDRRPGDRGPADRGPDDRG